jgi:ABC-2 type transport system permease protein
LDAPAPVPGSAVRGGPDDHGTKGSSQGDGPRALFGPGTGGRDPDRAKPVRVVSANVSLGRRIAEIWRSRELLIYLVRTEIRVKYKNSVLGLVWSMISPAMTLAIFYLVFQIILKNGIPNFVIFLFSGLLLWNFFQVGVLYATGTVVGNAGIVKKVAFPREILALASIGSAGVFLFFQSLVMVVFMLVLRSPPDWKLVPLLPLALLACVVFACALAVFLSAVNVYLRDTQHLVEVILSAWFWACPIVYSYQRTVAAKLHAHHLTWLYFLNPMTPLVMTFQRVLYNKTFAYTTTPDHTYTQFLPAWHWYVYAGACGIVLAVSLVLLLFALGVFGRLEGNFAEEL